MLPIHQFPGFLIRRLHQISTSVFAERMSREGQDLTPVQYAALTAIGSNPGLDQATLAGMIAYDRVTIGGVVDRLVSKGLVERETSARDRRARVLHLSAAGTSLLTRLDGIARAAQDDILSGLDPAEQAQFIKLMIKVTDAGNSRSRAPLQLKDTA
ncbi:MAG: MarR family transcriptional regulator [Pararhodobacter sp.]|nr:MarR family transcriptional regulator [Pararhodobacter sp.]